jgi:ferredoxin-nitrite reductase
MLSSENPRHTACSIKQKPARERIRVGNEMVEAVDVFMDGKAEPNPQTCLKVVEDVPCDELPALLERLIPYAGGKRPARVAAAAAASSASSLSANSAFPAERFHAAP